MKSIHYLLLFQIVTLAYLCSPVSALRGTPDKVAATAANEIPFAVSIGYKVNASPEDRHFCTGALISERHILTAAHCVFGEDGLMDPSEMSVIVGSHDLHLGRPYNVKNYTTYVGWKKVVVRPNDYDLAVLLLEKKVNQVTPGVISGKADSSLDKITATVVGYGGRDDDSFTQYLNKGTVELHKWGDCIELIRELDEPNRKRNSLRRFFLPENNLCSRNVQSDESYVIVQGGDSGGPLLDEKKEIIGVTLSVAPLSEEFEDNPKAQILHARINFFRDFIKAAMAKLK